MSLLRPISSRPIAIREALEQGWAAFASCPWVLMGFTLLVGGINLLSQVLYRYESNQVVGLSTKTTPGPWPWLAPPG